MRTFLLGLVLFGWLAAGDQQPGGYRLVGRWPDGSDVAGPGLFDDPHGIEITGGGDVFVADTGSSRVQQFTAGGTFVGEIGRPGATPTAGDLSEPMDVAATTTRLFVTDRARRSVMVFGRDGKFLAEWPGFTSPWGIAVAGNGDLYVADFGASQVVVLNSDGARIATISTPGTRPDELTGPRGLDVGADGLVYVADSGNQRVQIFTTGGRRIDTLALQQFNPALAAPTEDVSSDGNGNLYVLTAGYLMRLSRDASRRYQLQDTCVVGGGAGLDVDLRQAVFVVRSNRLLLQAEVIAFPYLGRCGDAKRFGAFGGVVRLQSASRIGRGPSGLLALVSDAGVTLHKTAGDLVGIVSGTTPPAQGGAVPNSNQRVQDAVFTADGSPIVANSLGAQRLAVNGSVVWRWPEPPTPTNPPLIGPPWLTGMAYDQTADRLYLLDIGHNLLAVRSADDAVIADQALPVPNGFAAYLDLALTPDGNLVAVNQTTKQVEIRSRDWQLIGNITAEGIPSRVATSGEFIFVMTRDGYVWRYRFRPGLAPVQETVWNGAPGGKGIDVEVLGDQVFVLDSVSNQVFVWAPDAGGHPEPPPPPAGAPSRCSVDAVALADPDVVLLGEPFSASLPVGGACPDTASRADIVLVIDRSGSMLSAGKMEAAKLAATNFISSVDFSQSQVAVVSFSNVASLDLPLTNNKAAATSAITSMLAVGGTDIAAGIGIAAAELASARRRPEAQGILILLTDGNSDERSALVGALETQLDGNRMFVIGLGSDVNGNLLTRLASAPGDYYFAPDGATLGGIYQAIAKRIRADVLFKKLTVHYELPAGIRFVDMIQGPAPVKSASALDWDLGAVNFGGTQIDFELVADQPGQQPAASRIQLRLVDGLGGIGSVDVSPPLITVLRPDRVYTPTPTSPPPPTPTPTPHPVYVPYALLRPCVATHGYSDVALVIDASGSMLEPTANGSSKLSAAKEAAALFASLLHLPDDQASIVQFNSASQVLLPLSGDIGEIESALDRITTAPGTRIDLGLAEGLRALNGPEAHAKRTKSVLVLLTDGLPSGVTPDEAVMAAAGVKGRGVEVFTVGLGTDVAPDLLRRIASDGNHAFLAPDAADLGLIYSRIAATLPCQ